MSDILTDADLAEIEKRAEAATSQVEGLRTTCHAYYSKPCRELTDREHHPGIGEAADTIERQNTDIPRLLKEIARLRGIEERAKAHYERLKYDSSDRGLIIDMILTGATWSDGIRIPPEGEGKVSEPDACHEEVE
jgi:hypothetical protein